MKAKYLIWIVNAVELVREYWKVAAVAVIILAAALSYRKNTKEIRRNSREVERISQQVQDLEAARVNVNAALEQLKTRELIIIEKYANERIKILHIPDSELQHWADSLYNAGR